MTPTHTRDTRELVYCTFNHPSMRTRNDAVYVEALGLQERDPLHLKLNSDFIHQKVMPCPMHYGNAHRTQQREREREQRGLAISHGIPWCDCQISTYQRRRSGLACE